MNTDNRIPQTSLSLLEAAVERATDRLHWNPIIADVFDMKQQKVVGHLASDGYRHRTWSFHPVSEKRRSVQDKKLDRVIPKWVDDFRLTNVRTYAEIVAILECDE